jgi:hypothetical protein
VRRDFPILSRTVYDQPLTYLDTAASAQKPKAVIEAINRAYMEEYAKVHRGLHFLSNAATDAYEKARETAVAECRVRHRAPGRRQDPLRHRRSASLASPHAPGVSFRPSFPPP